jgi:hypothetical protein
VSAVDFAHSAGANRRHDLIGSEPISRNQRGLNFRRAILAMPFGWIGRMSVPDSRRRNYDPAGISSTGFGSGIWAETAFQLTIR